MTDYMEKSWAPRPGSQYGEGAHWKPRPRPKLVVEYKRKEEEQLAEAEKLFEEVDPPSMNYVIGTARVYVDRYNDGMYGIRLNNQKPNQEELFYNVEAAFARIAEEF